MLTNFGKLKVIKFKLICMPKAKFKKENRYWVLYYKIDLTFAIPNAKVVGVPRKIL